MCCEPVSPSRIMCCGMLRQVAAAGAGTQRIKRMDVGSEVVQTNWYRFGTWSFEPAGAPTRYAGGTVRSVDLTPPEGCRPVQTSDSRIRYRTHRRVEGNGEGAVPRYVGGRIPPGERVPG